MPGPFPLSSEACTLDANGISAPPYEDVLSSKLARYQQIYGPDIWLGADSQDGEFIAILALAQHDVNQADIAAYEAYSPSTAQGVGLSSIVKINGIRRQIATRSTADLRLVGVAGTQVIAGLVEDLFGNRWALPGTVIIPVSGEVVATATCQVPGLITAAPDTINQIVNLQRGWQSASNTLAAIPGAPVEQDQALRQRQTISTNKPAQSPREAIESEIANVAGVQRVHVYENDEDAPDENGIPGHSIAPVVAGGDAFDIASAIALKKGPGCGTFGTVSEVVFDQLGVPNVINFFPLALVPIFVSITIQPFTGYLDAIGNLVTGAVIAAINGLDIGEDVYRARLWGPAGLSGDAATTSSGLTQLQLNEIANTFLVKEIMIGFSGTTLNIVDLPIAFYAAASCVAIDVTLILQP